MVNAIASAIGIDFDELPVTPDRVVETLIQRRRKAKRRYGEGRVMTPALAELHLVRPATVKEAVATLPLIPRAGWLPAGLTWS